MNPVEISLRQEIAQAGSVPLGRFMELALYHPLAGYYERGRQVIGAGGDFYTNLSPGSLFGELLASQFAAWLEPLPAGPLQLVEAGAHDGQLAADILRWLHQNRPDLLARVQYWIIEPSPRRQQWQAEKLGGFGERVRWFAGFVAASVTGIIFSNELLDAFPIVRWGWDAARQDWFEWGVTCNPAGFAWCRRVLADPRIVGQQLRDAGIELPDALRPLLPDGFVVEFSPSAGAWWMKAAAALHAGKLLTLDYGFTAEEFLDPRRAQGTLRAYRGHRLQPEVLAHPGEQDLTAHVHFTQLQTGGEQAGLRTDGLWSQARFLTTIAERAWQSAGAGSPWTPHQTRQFQTLIHPDHLGRAFRVLVQSRSQQ